MKKTPQLPFSERMILAVLLKKPCTLEEIIAQIKKETVYIIRWKPEKLLVTLHKLEGIAYIQTITVAGQPTRYEIAPNGKNYAKKAFGTNDASTNSILGTLDL